jgi:orotate phosphoribosyltransferase
MAELADLLDVVKRRGHRVFDQPVRLASGNWSRHFVDVKRALADGADARMAAELLIERVGGAAFDAAALRFDAVGGLTMGADVVAYTVAVVAGRGVEWFSVRKAAKERGTKQRIEGAPLGEGRRVLLVEDAVTTGGSIGDALEAVRETGAVVVAAATVVDRGEFAAALFSREEIPYFPLLTYRDLGIPPIGSEPEAVSG